MVVGQDRAGTIDLYAPRLCLDNPGKALLCRQSPKPRIVLTHILHVNLVHYSVFLSVGNCLLLLSFEHSAFVLTLM
jgi:hypothetical protein